MLRKLRGWHRRRGTTIITGGSADAMVLESNQTCRGARPCADILVPSMQRTAETGRPSQSNPDIEFESVPERRGQGNTI